MNYIATLFDATATHELGTVVGKSYDDVWRIALGMTPHPVLEWIEGGPSGRESV
jgi:hypothetical protein